MKTVSFSGTCAARGEVVLCTPIITYPYVLRKVHCRFPIGCVDKLKLRFFVSPDDDTPSTGAPNGYSMLREHGQVDYILGDGDQKDLDHEVEIEDSGTYLKVWAVNDDYFEHLVDVQMTIVPVERKE